MSIQRRTFLKLAAAGAAFSAGRHAAAARRGHGRALKALAFDAFPIFDPRPVFALAEKLFPGKGADLGNAWRVRQFEYQWLRALMNRYADFWQATEDALVFATQQLKLELTPQARRALMHAYLELPVWPDVPAALRTLREMGVRLAFLSNATPAILNAGIRNAELDGVFEHVLSTDALKTYKPDPRAYGMGPKAFGLALDEIGFVAFAGWDAAGAKSFGYRTFWVNRLKLPPEELGVTADGAGAGMAELVEFVRNVALAA